MRNALPFLLALLCLASPPVFADNPPLQVTTSVTNGATYADAATVGPDDVQPDTAIRIFVNLTNRSGSRVKVTQVACTFFDSEGKELSRDEAQPMELRARQQGTAVLYYYNAAALYAFKAVGTVQYQQDGKTFSIPFNVSEAQVPQSYKNGVGY